MRVSSSCWCEISLCCWQLKCASMSMLVLMVGVVGRFKTKSSDQIVADCEQLDTRNSVVDAMRPDAAFLGKITEI